MKRETAKFSKGEKKRKLKIDDIKKNSDIEISHTISKIKSDDRKIIFAMSLVIFCLIGVVACFVFATISVEKIEGEKTGPLYVKFGENKDGMSDIVNFVEENSDGEIYSTSFTITNYKGSNSWYIVYLEDYQDMIYYHKCGDREFNKDEIYFSIDNSVPIMLSSANYGGKYVITEGIVGSNTNVKHVVKVWHTGNENSHFHGKIVVKFLR